MQDKKVYHIPPVFFCKKCGREMKVKKSETYRTKVGECKVYTYVCWNCRREWHQDIYPNKEWSYRRVILDIRDAAFGEIRKYVIDGNER